MPRLRIESQIRQHQPAGLRHAFARPRAVLDSPAFEITAPNSEDYEVVVRYADRELLESGWLVGEDNLTRRAAVVSAKLGQGKVVPIGFPAQHRAQTHGTYKLLFNALVR